MPISYNYRIVISTDAPSSAASLPSSANAYRLFRGTKVAQNLASHIDIKEQFSIPKQAHNLKAAGSNPAPATTDREAPDASGAGAFFVFSPYRSTNPAACITPANRTRTVTCIWPFSWRMIVMRSITAIGLRTRA